jgi:hypothetical protein
VNINGIESYEEIESIQAPQTEIYGKIQNNSIQICSPNDTGSIFLGTTGFCEFWYTDERPGNYTTEDKPIFIFATIDNAKFNDAFTERTNAFDYIDYPPYGYQNMQPAIFPGIKTRYNSANHLSITTTGIDGEGTLSTTQFEIPKISWQETDIPFVIKFKDALGYTTKNYPPLSSSYVQRPTIPPVSAYDVQLGIGTYNVSGALVPLPNVTFYEDFDPNTLPQSTGAFYKGYLKATQSSENCVLTASVNVVEPAFYTKDALVGWIGIPQYNSSFRILRQDFYNKYKFGTKTVTFTDNQALFPTDDNRNIYAIAVAPVGTVPENDYQTWIADSVNDRILKYDIYGNALPVYYYVTYTLSTTGDYVPSYYYSLSAMPTVINNQVIISDFRTPSISGFPSIASPNSIAIDKSNNVWVTLLDSGSAIKINTSTGYVTTIAHTAPLSGNTSLGTTVLSSAYTSLSGFAGENIVLPASIDIDQDNNAWITYTHPLFSRIVKYQGEDNDSPIANILATFSFPEGISPDEICIDRNKCVWVTALNHNYDRGTFNTSSDLLYKFDLNCNLLSGFPLSGFKQIGNLTIDGYQNAWVSQDRETITQIDNTTLRMTNYIAGSGNNDTNYIGSIGGITCDTSNYIWVINNFDKKMYLIDSERPPGDYLSYRYSIDLTYPTPSLPPVTAYGPPSSAYNIPVDQYSDGLQAFQAYGDWNGYRWINKYSVPYNTVRTITGSSNLFNIYPDTGAFNITKVNENWNASGYYNGLRYQESLLDKQVFFDQFLGVILGGLSAQPYELGKTVYEKIANFVDNRADIDKCNLDALLDLCKELSIEFEEYNYLFPPQVRRLVDMLSIKQSNLWGTQNKYNLNFDSRGTIFPNDAYGINLGTEINPLTGYFAFDTPVVAYEIFSGNYKLVNTNYINSDVTYLPVITSYNSIEDYTTVYSNLIALSSYTSDWGWSLVAPDNITGTAITGYYKFYNYKPADIDTYYNNIIDWKDFLTTLSPTNSSYNTWSNDNGIMQNMFSYELTKGFKLFTSAANITYNS